VLTSNRKVDECKPPVHIIYQCALAHSPHPPPWPYTRAHSQETSGQAREEVAANTYKYTEQAVRGRAGRPCAWDTTWEPIAEVVKRKALDHKAGGY
jgi:hypothetical protein